jgi:hypothetical protein
MWRNIAAELSISHAGQISSEGVSDVAGRPEAIDSQDAAPPRRGPARKDAAPPRRGPARSRFTLMLAAAVGLIAGVGGTVLVNVLNEPEIQVVAGTTLSPLPGQAGEGTAQLVREQGTTELRVSVTGSAPAEEYREVWLINTDGKRMYSLGVLPGAGTGTYAVPAGLGEELDGFTIVDVSLEPYDGNAAHSLRSQVRGTLPV